MSITLGCDISNYTGLVDDKLNCYYEAGVRRFIVGCQDMAIARRQCEAIIADGRFEIDGTYAFLYWGSDTTGQTANAIALAERYNLPRVWLDCEDATEGFSADEIVQMITECANLVDAVGLEVGIYTGAYWWMGATNNSEHFSADPLWHASYWDDGHFQQEVNYGGWTKAAIHQYASTPELCGRNEDRNVWFDEEDKVTREEYNALIKRLEYLELASFSGGEDARAGHDYDVRVGIAAMRIDDRVNGDPGNMLQSIASEAASASANLAAHLSGKLP